MKTCEANSPLSSFLQLIFFLIIPSIFPNLKKFSPLSPPLYLGHSPLHLCSVETTPRHAAPSLRALGPCCPRSLALQAPSKGLWRQRRSSAVQVRGGNESNLGNSRALEKEGRCLGKPTQGLLCGIICAKKIQTCFLCGKLGASTSRSGHILTEQSNEQTNGLGFPLSCKDIADQRLQVMARGGIGHLVPKEALR